MGNPLQGRFKAAAGGGWGGANNITRSAWFDGSADHLDRTPGAASSDRTRQIWGTWIRRLRFSANSRGFFGAGTGATARAMQFLSSHKFYWEASAGITATSVRVFRDSEWFQLVVSYDGNESTNADKLKVYLNGEEIELTFSGTLPTTPQHFGDTVLHTIGANTSVAAVHDGLMAQAFHVADASIQNGDHAITDFGESVTTGTNGSIWAPVSDAAIKSLVDAGGTNSFLLSSAFGDGTDDSAKGNDWTPTSMSDAANGSDDTPSSPLPVFNPLHKSAVTTTISEGGQRANLATGAGWLSITQLVPSTGKYYVEFLGNTVSNGNMAVGVCNPNSEQDATPRASGFLHWEADGDRYLDGVQTATEVTSWTSTDVVGLGINMDDKQLLFYDNAGNLDATVAFGSNVDGSDGVLLYLGQLSGSGAQNATLIIESAGMTHGLPTGYKELRYSNVPAPEYQGSDVFEAVTYTGNGSTQSITGVGFQPDVVWGKGRTNTFNPELYDSSRGTTLRIYPSAGAVEDAHATGLTSFDSDGFSLGSGVALNSNSVGQAAWCWKTNGGTTASNTDGDITSTVQVAPEGHMSIIQYVGNATSGQTVGHGLSSAPDMIIHKNRDSVDSWRVWANGMSTSQAFYLDLNFALTTDNMYTADPTDTLLTLGSHSGVNGNTQDHVAYAFRNVPGLLRAGTYIGNGNASGPYIPVGFLPRYLLIKGNVSPQEWLIYDTARQTYNDGSTLYFQHDNSADVEGTDFKDVDILADGFKLRDTTTTHNQSGTLYFYLAIADVATGEGLPPIPGR